MSALVGLVPLTALFGWLGLIGSVVLDLTVGAGLAIAISALFRATNGT